jgi:MOSC domain-containing protein YiiM
MGIICDIYTAAAKGAAMEARRAVVARAGEGLVGDRYSLKANRRGPKYELTLIEIEAVEAFAREVDPAFTAWMPRRNIVTREIGLNLLSGRQFRLGEVVCEGIELCEPCTLFAKRTRREVLKFFGNRGGLRARIVQGGEIRVGDAVIAQQ